MRQAGNSTDRGCGPVTRGPMKIHRSYNALATADQGAAVAIGNFDGVHLGHQSVIALARAAAAELSAPLGVLTFEPHPRSFFAPEAPSFRLMNAVARAHRLEKMDIGHLYELPFNDDLASLTAEEFIERVLVWGLAVRHVVVGADFRFGNGRTGDAALLEQMGRDNGYGVTVAPLISDAKGDFSSTAIRDALSAGHPAEAARMLGHWHRVDGRVEKGDQRGRNLGYPTANLSMDGLHLPKFGVYAVLIDVQTGPHAGRYHGAASLGVRPTFGVNHPNLESFLFDFEGDIYGEEISVALVSYIREEERFDDLGALIARMDDDCDRARGLLASLAPLG